MVKPGHENKVMTLEGITKAHTYKMDFRLVLSIGRLAVSDPKLVVFFSIFHFLKSIGQVKFKAVVRYACAQGEKVDIRVWNRGFKSFVGHRILSV